MILKLNQVGQPILRYKSKKVDLNEIKSFKTKEFINFMASTLRDAPGVGLAAPQIGLSKQIIILEDKSKYLEIIPKEIIKKQKRKPFSLKVLFNPTLEVINSKMDSWFEGCLSVDGYVAVVDRYSKVKIIAFDAKGEKVSLIAEGWMARILQHEIDHLNGNLFIDKMHSRSFMTVKYFNQYWRKKNDSEIKANYI